jgi:Mg-chelatase subunit ChlD
MKLRPLAAAPALAVMFVLAACAGALEAPLAHAAPAHTTPAEAWPPVWQDAPAAAPAEFGPAVFEPPSASHCRRPPSTREVPGGGVEQRGAHGGARTRLSASVAGAVPGAVVDAATGTDMRRKEESARLADSERSRPDAATVAPSAPSDSRAAEAKSAAKSRLEARSEAPAAPAAVTSATSASPARELTLMPAPNPAPRPPRPAHETVTAGVVDDNADFGEYLAFRQRRAGLPVRERDVSERYLLEVTDAAGRPVHDAEVAVQRPGVAQPVMWARTDTAGKVWLHPRAFLAGGMDSLAEGSRTLGVAVRKNGVQGRALLVAGQANAVQVRLSASPTTPTAAAQRPRLDLVFMIDATGSMGDEIAKLKSSMRAMSQQISQLPGQPDICYGLVAYRDRGDAFITRTHDFTDDLGAFQGMLARVQAGGGGDTPEALNEALHEVVHRLDWRADAARMVVMVADAPPHLDYGGPQYDRDMQAALAKGIKLFAVGASGLDPVGEYVFRQMAQYTAGRFVFLTYQDAANPGSGPGTQTVHDVKQYSVQTLDRLVVRLVGDEMARLSRS